MNLPSKPIYKICDKTLWTKAEQIGEFTGAEIDLADGFIHFSTAEQVSSTLEKHFSGRTDLVLIAVNTVGLGDKVRYEEARGGMLFPHLYEPLSLAHIEWVKPIEVDKDGRHIVPALSP